MRQCLHKKNSIYFADKNNLSSFTKVNSPLDVRIRDYAIINGVIVVRAVDNYYYRIGYCDIKNGETEITYTSSSTSPEYTDFKIAGNNLVANTNSNLVFTTNGKTWNTTSLSATGKIEYFDHKLWQFNPTSWNYTNESDLSIATWATDQIDVAEQNTSSTAGTFLTAKFISMVSPNEWRSYGKINNDVSCLNISYDQGNTWGSTQTFPIEHYIQYATKVLYTESHTYLSNGLSVYSATNKVDFTVVADQSQSVKIQHFGAFRVY